MQALSPQMTAPAHLTSQPGRDQVDWARAHPRTETLVVLLADPVGVMYHWLLQRHPAVVVLYPRTAEPGDLDDTKGKHDTQAV
jgi:hypothetical protein